MALGKKVGAARTIINNGAGPIAEGYAIQADGAYNLGKAVVTSAAQSTFFGVANETIPATKHGNCIVTATELPLVASGVITIGAELAVDSAVGKEGRFRVAIATDLVVGKALQAATDGNLFLASVNFLAPATK